MSNFILSCCSTADLTKEHFGARDIKYVCFHFELDGKEYPDDLGESMSFDAFYQAMKDGAMTKTSQVNVAQYEEFWEPFLKDGKDILHLTLSSGISGTYNSATIAQGILQEKYPDRKIYVVDSLCAASGYGLLMDKLADLRDEGKSVDEVRDWAEENKLRVHHWVVPTELTYLIRGGRVSKASGFVGSILNICPLIMVDAAGKLLPVAKIRTKKKALATLVAKMEEFADNGFDYNEKCYLSHSASLEDAKSVATMIEERFPKLKEPVEIDTIGTVIGSHTGPGTVVLFFWGKKREE